MAPAVRGWDKLPLLSLALLTLILQYGSVLLPLQTAQVSSAVSSFLLKLSQLCSDLCVLDLRRGSEQQVENLKKRLFVFSVKPSAD